MKFFLIILSLVFAKNLKSTISLSKEQPAQYITKFGVDLGTGHYDIRVRISKGKKDYTYGKTYPIELLLYRDSDWDMSAFTCESKHKAVNITLNIPSDGRWSESFSGELGEPDVPHIWFFTIADCNLTLGDSSKLRIELSILSGDKSELSVEMKGMKRIYIFVCIIFVLMLGNNIWKLYKYFTAVEEIETNLVMLNLAVVFQFISMIFHILHISAYEGNGRGVGAFVFFGNATGLISQYIMIVLLLLIADGWTILYKNFPSPEAYLSVIILVGLLNLIIAAVERTSDDAYYLFSSFEGTVGWCLLAFYTIHFVWFVLNIRALFAKVPGNMRPFLQRFAVASSIYILSLPLLIGIAQLLLPYKRHKFISGANLLVEGLTMLILSYLFTRKTQYYKLSTMADSMLPTSKSHSN